MVFLKVWSKSFNAFRVSARFCLTGVTCFYAVARILKNLFVYEVKFGFIKIKAYVGILMGKEIGNLQSEICALQPGPS